MRERLHLSRSHRTARSEKDRQEKKDAVKLLNFGDAVGDQGGEDAAGEMLLLDLFRQEIKESENLGSIEDLAYLSKHVSPPPKRGHQSLTIAMHFTFRSVFASFMRPGRSTARSAP